jgi:ABC-type nickel/cobalt efflux system permease component RcnA
VTRPERPVPPPLEGDDRLITAVITAGFAVALIVLLIVRDSLAAADRWWVWVAAFGTVLGLFGLVYVPHLKRSRERAAARQQAARYHSATDIMAADGPPAAGGVPADHTAGGVPADHTVTGDSSSDATRSHPPR